MPGSVAFCSHLETAFLVRLNPFAWSLVARSSCDSPSFFLFLDMICPMECIFMPLFYSGLVSCFPYSIYQNEISCKRKNLQIRANWTYVSVDSRLIRALYWSAKETLHELYYETVIVWKGGRCERSDNFAQ